MKALLWSDERGLDTRIQPTRQGTAHFKFPVVQDYLRKRESIVKIIGSGFGRTGTLSLKSALEVLYLGPCYHMVEVFQHPEHMALWQAAADGQNIDWETILGGYNAAVDWPAAAFYESLMQRYPDAKVILTVRDPEAWYLSVARTIGPTVSAHKGGDASFRQMADRVIWDGTFDGRFDEKAYALEIFEQHIRKVKETVPRDRLLVYEVSQGWEPLCRFLAAEVPENTPFPRLNTFEQIQRRREERDGH